MFYIVDEFTLHARHGRRSTCHTLIDSGDELTQRHLRSCRAPIEAENRHDFSKNLTLFRKRQGELYPQF
jgi:hypothetical protein